MPPRRTAFASRLAPLILMILLAVGAAPAVQSAEGNTSMTTDEIKHAALGDWVSIAPEVRPSALKNPDGTLKPFYLTRAFKALPGDQFELTVVNSADPFGKVPLARILIKGHMIWRGDHPIAAGAQKVDFVADEAYEVTPLLQGFADVLNKISAEGYAKWDVGETQSVFGKTFAPFGLAAGKNFMEYDLVYLSHDMLFGGRATSTAAASTPSRTGRPTSRSRSSGNDEGSLTSAKSCAAVGRRGGAPIGRYSAAAAFAARIHA